MTRIKWILLFCGLTLAILVLIGLLGSVSLTIKNHVVTDSDLPSAFSGFRIAHISDLHNAEFGQNNETLLKAIREAEPDIIVVTGDLIDSRQTDVDISASFMEQAVKIAPCYYVYGNHETRRPNEYAQLRNRMKDCGVTILEDKTVLLHRGDEAIQIAGLMDYSKLSDIYVSYLFEPGYYTLLLTHRPEHFDVYTRSGADLVLAGHAHGGQIRLPLIGALYAPGQGLFPSYADGLHSAGSTTMVVSSGLGNSLLPFRFYCPPELVIIELTCE